MFRGAVFFRTRCRSSDEEDHSLCQDWMLAIGVNCYKRGIAIESPITTPSSHRSTKKAKLTSAAHTVKTDFEYSGMERVPGFRYENRISRCPFTATISLIEE